MEEEFKKLELEKKWSEHFDDLLSKSRRHSVEAGDKISNLKLNRYLDVIPYDRSRVKLNRTTDTDYINANIVTVPKAARQYILTQGPLQETLSHFWLMVWEQKSHVIVMLNRIVEPLLEEDLVKCEQYWPKSKGSKEYYEDVQLSVTLTDIKETKHYTVRSMLLHDNKSGEDRKITQFQYKAWPDHDQPDSPTSFLRLLSAVRKSGGLDKMDEPTIVHCSAGIGRSGTFCLIDSILCMVENQGSTEGIDIDNTLVEMRDYRMGLIQTPVQLRFAYMSIIYGIKILESANKLHPHISSIKDSIIIDSNSPQNNRVNGSSHSNGKRRNKKKSSNNNSSSLNVFKKDLLVEALDDVDSDSADSMFEDAMKTCSSIKKARNSSPEDDFNAELLKGIKPQVLHEVVQSLFAEKKISSNEVPESESVLLRRREREQRNQKIAEKTMEIKNRMKEEDQKRERMSTLKKSMVFGGVAALVLSSVVYFFIH